jgi:hypothetical protein
MDDRAKRRRVEAGSDAADVAAASALFAEFFKAMVHVDTAFSHSSEWEP